MSAGGRLCALQENPHFWVLTIRVRPPDGTYWDSGITVKAALCLTSASVLYDMSLLTAVASVTYIQYIPLSRFRTIH